MSELRFIEYTDAAGRRSRRGIPEGAPDADAVAGIVVGPPPLSFLGLPVEMEVRLNNEFYARELFTEADIRKRRTEAVAAIMAAFKVDVELILAGLNELGGNQNGNAKRRA